MLQREARRLCTLHTCALCLGGMVAHRIWAPRGAYVAFVARGPVDVAALAAPPVALAEDLAPIIRCFDFAPEQLT